MSGITSRIKYMNSMMQLLKRTTDICDDFIDTPVNTVNVEVALDNIRYLNYYELSHIKPEVLDQFYDKIKYLIKLIPARNVVKN